MAKKIPPQGTSPPGEENVLVNSKEGSAELDIITQAASAISIQEFAPKEFELLVSPHQVVAFIKTIANTHGILDSQAFVATSLLFLKGAANKSAPAEMSVEIVADDGTKVSITKIDLECACYHVLKNKFLRRIAEAMGDKISTYAAANSLSGDLANRLNNAAIAKGESPLNTNERAWSNSFCQKLPNLQAKAGDRIAILLADDYKQRFESKKGKKDKVSKKGEDLTPRKVRQGKPKGKQEQVSEEKKASEKKS